MFELRKLQASSFFKTARLALTDVTPSQLLTEEATNANPCAPDTPTLALISKSAFELDDYCRIVDILHNKLSKFDRKNWRASYNSLIVLEYLLTHGPESVAKDFQTDKPVLKDMADFHHIDEKGFNWGLAVRKKCERTLKLLDKGAFLKEERENARKLKREIKGFGSFSATANESSITTTAFARTHSQFNQHYNFKSSNDQPPLLSRHVQPEKLKLISANSKENTVPRNDIEDGNTHPFKDSDKHSRVSLLDTQAQD